MPLLEFSPAGIHCPQAGIYIDPWKKVGKALLTHGHADHARWGMDNYLCTASAAPVIQHRLNLESDRIQTVAYGEKIFINGVQFSFHPAGHVIGSAQIRVEYRGEVWVVSGDYKTDADGISEPFEPVRCHTLITESTFGLPVYQWQPQQQVFEQINQWWRKNRQRGVNSVLLAYSLGKAQRILANVDAEIGPIYAHMAVENLNKIIRRQGFSLPQCHHATTADRDKIRGALIIAPPSAAGTPWMRRFAPYELGVASGWMSIRGARRRRAADIGFVLSDHADWKGLNDAVDHSGAETIYVTHGYSDIFAQWLSSKGLDGRVVETAYGDDDAAEPEIREEVQQ